MPEPGPPGAPLPVGLCSPARYIDPIGPNTGIGQQVHKLILHVSSPMDGTITSLDHGCGLRKPVFDFPHIAETGKLTHRFQERECALGGANVRANLRRVMDGEEAGPLLQLHGEYRTLANLVCYGIYPFALRELGMQNGDRLAAHIYSNPDLSREGEPDRKIVVTIGSAPPNP